MNATERKALEDLARKWESKRSLLHAACAMELRGLLDKEAGPTLRYDWSKAPDWAKWTAVDEDGNRFVYEWCPTQDTDTDGGFWIIGSVHETRLQKVGRTSVCPDWRESLEARP